MTGIDSPDNTLDEGNEVMWHVQSSSDPDVMYVVSCRRGPEGPQWECGCVGWFFLSTKYPGKKCKHIKSCEETLISGVQRMYYSTDSHQPAT